MDDTLKKEQGRQMEKMRGEMKVRNSQITTDKTVRQIKLAELQKKKEQDLERAKDFIQFQGEKRKSVNDKLQQAITKASLMQKLAYKQAYSKPIFVKKYQDKQQRLYAFLGQGLMADWENSVDEDAMSRMSELSIDTKLVDREINNKQAITYKLLLEHIQNAESNFERIKQGGINAKADDNVSQFLSAQGRQ